MLSDEAESVLAECHEGGGISDSNGVSEGGDSVVVVVFEELVMVLQDPIHVPSSTSPLPSPIPPLFPYAPASEKPATTRKVSPLCCRRLSPGWRETPDNYGNGRPDVRRIWGSGWRV